MSEFDQPALHLHGQEALGTVIVDARPALLSHKAQAGKTSDGQDISLSLFCASSIAQRHLSREQSHLQADERVMGRQTGTQEPVLQKHCI